MGILDNVPCFTFGWLLIYLIIASMLFKALGAKATRFDPKTKERTEGNMLGKVAGFFSEVVVRRVTEAELLANELHPDMLSNLNTPAELEEARNAAGLTEPDSTA